MRVLLTRQKNQVAGLKKLLKANGHQAEVLPVIAIASPEDSEPAIELVENLQDFDIAIFISANAVHESAKFIKTYARAQDLNSYLKIAAIGPSTAKALAEYDWQTDIMPDNKFDSEGLLASPKLQEVKNKNIIIFRGVGGRRLLSETLTARGATVSEAVTYERSVPKVSKDELGQVFSKGKFDAIVVMSNESLNNLYTLISPEDRAELLQSQLVVISQRAADLARDLKFENPAIIAETPDELSIFTTLRTV